LFASSPRGTNRRTGVDDFDAGRHREPELPDLVAGIEGLVTQHLLGVGEQVGGGQIGFRRGPGDEVGEQLTPIARGSFLDGVERVESRNGFLECREPGFEIGNL
jgi:hypothetical protein